MIRSRGIGSRPTPSNQPYRSARAVSPPKKRSGAASSRLRWFLAKAILILSGLYLVYLCLDSKYAETNNNITSTSTSTSTSDTASNTASNTAAVGNMGGSDSGTDNKSYLGRGVSGLPMDETPALLGASRGHIECDMNVDRLVYWNSPQGKRDLEFKTPFASTSAASGSTKTKYISFEPDRGGWNNIRMNLENIFVFAAATGRTLVLPPDVPLYLMNKDSTEKHKGFGDFFPLHSEEFQSRLSVISTKEFLEREGGKNGQFPIPEEDREDVMRSAPECDKRAKSDISCDHVVDYLEASAFVPQINATNCIVFDEALFETGSVSSENEKKAKEFCSPRDDKLYYITQEIQEEPLIHFKNKKGWRIMAHYYGYMYFTDPKIFNYYKRFVRDLLHYHDEIYCAAGKIVLALQEEGQAHGFKLDREGGAGYSSMHVRRGDLQYKKVKITAEEWYDNLKDTWQENELIYIATDERNKTFFDPIKEHNNVKFLDDYWEMAGLGNLDPNYMGMIDTIVASRGRTFGGTFFSTFSGYINRMRGYHGMSMMDSYYGFLPKKNITHEWREHYSGVTFSFEWPNGWIGIDGDKEVTASDKF